MSTHTRRSVLTAIGVALPFGLGAGVKASLGPLVAPPGTVEASRIGR